MNRYEKTHEILDRYVSDIHAHHPMMGYWEHNDLRATIERTIYYFNNERPVRKLKGKPPVLFRTELVA